MPAQRQNLLAENLWLALDTLRTHKFRSFLTMLGIVIGTFTAIAVSSVVAGLDRQMVEVAQDFGTRTLWIFKFEPGIKFRLNREERMRKPLTYEDMLAIRELCPSVEAASAEAFRMGPPTLVKYKGQEMLDAEFSGATPEHLRLLNAVLADGRFFTDMDNLHRRHVVVIGQDLITRFFEHEDPIGKSIIVDGHIFEVIGTLGKRKQFLGDTSHDRLVYIPYFTYRALYPENKENFISALAYEGKMEEAKDEIAGVLRRRRNVKPWEPDNFGISSAEALVTQFRDMMAFIALVLVVLSSIGLLVGGIGVMNIMLVSVTERTREIGVRKAIGARRRDVTWQFLLEAMTLTGSGGLVGVLLGVVAGFLIRWLYPVLPYTIPLWAVAAGFVVSVSVGLFFGMWPAVKASKLDPIVALRYE